MVVTQPRRGLSAPRTMRAMSSPMWAAGTGRSDSAPA
jgi:hypothetical protein